MTDQPPQPPRPTIVIELLPDGTVGVTGAFPTRNVALMMLEAAKIDVLEHMKQARPGRVVAAPPGLVVPRT